MITTNRTTPELLADVHELIRRARLDLPPTARPRSAPIYLREARRAIALLRKRIPAGDPAEAELLSLMNRATNV